MFLTSFGILIALVLAGIAAIGSVFGSRLVYWIALGCGFLSGIVLGIVVNGFPKGAYVGICYGTIFLILFSTGGLARYFRRIGKARLDKMIQAPKAITDHTLLRNDMELDKLKKLQMAISLTGILICGIAALVMISICWINSCKKDYSPIDIAFVLMACIPVFMYVFLMQRVKGKLGIVLLGLFIISVLMIIARILRLL